MWREPEGVTSNPTGTKARGIENLPPLPEGFSLRQLEQVGVAVVVEHRQCGLSGCRPQEAEWLGTMPVPIGLGHLGTVDRDPDELPVRRDPLSEG